MPAELVALQVRRSLFLNVSLCLCRACLGKAIKLGTKWHDNTSSSSSSSSSSFFSLSTTSRDRSVYQGQLPGQAWTAAAGMSCCSKRKHLLRKEKEHSTETTVDLCRRRPMRSPSAAQKVRSCLVLPLPFPVHETRSSVATTGSGRTDAVSKGVEKTTVFRTGPAALLHTALCGGVNVTAQRQLGQWAAYNAAYGLVAVVPTPDRLAEIVPPCLETLRGAKKRLFDKPFLMLKPIVLPRQARDKQYKTG